MQRRLQALPTDWRRKRCTSLALAAWLSALAISAGLARPSTATALPAPQLLKDIAPTTPSTVGSNPTNTVAIGQRRTLALHSECAG